VAALTDGEEAIVISGRESRSVKRWRNKKVGSISQLQSRCKKGSRRWKKLQRSKNKVKAKVNNKCRDLSHKASRKVVTWCTERGVKTLVVGKLRGIAEGKRLSRKSQQKISQWEHYRHLQYFSYKLKDRGGEVITISEEGSSSKCPCCGRKSKPKGRLFRCHSCGLIMHRDVKGAVGILSLYVGGQVFPSSVEHPNPKRIKYLHPDDFRRSRAHGTRRSADLVMAGCGLGLDNERMDSRRAEG
jgi:putative transposase